MISEKKTFRTLLKENNVPRKKSYTKQYRSQIHHLKGGQLRNWQFQQIHANCSVPRT